MHLSQPAIFKSKVTETQASTIRERILRAALDVQYQEEQHGATLILVLKCRPEHAHALKDVLSSVGIHEAGDDDLDLQ